MIQVSNAVYKALRADSVELAYRVTWKLTRSTAGLDITDRCLQISEIGRSLAPFLGGQELSDCTILLANEDGRFTTGLDSSFLRSGPQGYYMTEIKIEQGPRLPSGSVEYIDVFVGRVNYVRTLRDTIEIKLVGKIALLSSQPLPEDFAFGVPGGSSTQYTDPGTVITDLIAFTTLSASDLDTTTNGWTHINSYLHAAGWLIAGSVRRGNSVGDAILELARSCLSAFVELESGKLTLLPLVLPRSFGVGYIKQIDFPDRLEDPFAFGFELIEGVGSTASEIIVGYAGTSVSYRATADEILVGRMPRVVSMQFCRLGSQAAWAARLIYEWHALFPRVYGFQCPGTGLLLQLGDRVNIKDPTTGQSRKAIVTGKVWHPETVGISVMTNPAETTIFEGDFATWDSDAWGGVLL